MMNEQIIKCVLVFGLMGGMVLLYLLVYLLIGDGITTRRHRDSRDCDGCVCGSDDLRAGSAERTTARRNPAGRERRS